jgi:hypothetical protein
MLIGPEKVHVTIFAAGQELLEAKLSGGGRQSHAGYDSELAARGLYDEYKAQEQSAPALIAQALTQAELAQLQSTDGVYSASYMPTIQGEFKIQVKIRGNPVHTCWTHCVAPREGQFGRMLSSPHNAYSSIHSPTYSSKKHIESTAQQMSRVFKTL